MFNMYVPTRFVFGNGRLNELHTQKLPGKKAMLAISNGKSMRENGTLARTEQELQKAGVDVAVFAGIGANPTKTSVMEGAQFARDNGCDFIVALGGGSVMDASKAIAMMATNEGDLWDYVGAASGKGLTMKNEPLPVVCITTTAGTGSEADPWGVVTKEETNEKLGLGGADSLFPVLSIRMSEMFQEKSIEIVGKYLARAVRDGNDMEAREQMAFANTLSGFSMVLSSTTAEHSLEMAISAYYPELSHGAGLIMISKAFYECMIEKHACDDRMVRMAQALGMKDATKPEDFITALVKLQEDCGVADLKMSDYGVTPDDFEKMAANARETGGGLFATTPCELAFADCVRIYEKSYR